MEIEIAAELLRMLIRFHVPAVIANASSVTKIGQKELSILCSLVPGEKMSYSQLAFLTKMQKPKSKKSSFSTLISEMQKKGLIEKQTIILNKKNVLYVWLTEKGANMRKIALQEMLPHLHEVMKFIEQMKKQTK